MAINPPVSHTIISTQQWGIPLTNEVNRLTNVAAAAAPTAWTAPTLMNGFTNFGAPFQVCQYRKVGDMVQIRGLLVTPVTTVTTIFSLPVGFRPPGVLQFSQDSGQFYALIQVSSNGDVSLQKANAAASSLTCIVSFSITA